MPTNQEPKVPEEPQLALPGLEGMNGAAPIERPIPDFSAVTDFHAADTEHQARAESAPDNLAKQGMNEVAGSEIARQVAVRGIKKVKSARKTAAGNRKNNRYYPRRDPQYDDASWEEH